jgi:hypothetical protein
MKRMTQAYISLVAITVALPTSLLLQTVTPENPLSMISQLKETGLVGVALLACWVLWRALQKKDADNVTLIKAASEALLMSAESNKELREMVKDSTRSKDHLAEVIGGLVEVVRGCKVHERDSR